MSLDMILSNKKYCGLSVVKSGKSFYEIDNHHEPIITLEVFERTQVTKAERTNIEIGEDGRKIRKRTKFTSQKALKTK